MEIKSYWGVFPFRLKTCILIYLHSSHTHMLLNLQHWEKYTFIYKSQPSNRTEGNRKKCCQSIFSSEFEIKLGMLFFYVRVSVCSWEDSSSFLCYWCSSYTWVDFFLHKKLFKNYMWRQNRMTMLPSCLKSPTDNINPDFQVRRIRITEQSLVITERYEVSEKTSLYRVPSLWVCP